MLPATSKTLPRAASAGVRAVQAKAAPTATVTKPAVTIPNDVAPLFQPFTMGPFELSNRMVYPPLTRCRAIDMVPNTEMTPKYYAQRAQPGTLLISEGTVVSRDGHGYPHTPGIYTPEQVEAWKPSTRAVKDKGAVFFCQLWHCGRASHPAFLEGGAAPLSSSAVAISSEEWKGVWTGTEMDVYPVPVALDKAGIKAKVAAFAKAARNSIDAGFDGVEIHGANGYLIDQFTKDGINKRTDEYGGPIENRCRFALEVVEAVVAEVGAERVGIRLSPFNPFLDANDSTPYATFMYLVEQLNKHKLAYIHMVEARVAGSVDNPQSSDNLDAFRKVWKGAFIAAGGFNRETGAQAVASGHADLVAYGRLWIANPDLPQRFIKNAPLTKYDRNTFYSHGPEGYIDYPFMQQ